LVGVCLKLESTLELVRMVNMELTDSAENRVNRLFNDMIETREVEIKHLELLISELDPSCTVIRKGVLRGIQEGLRDEIQSLKAGTTATEEQE
jgi:hypothetical protein